MTPGRKNIKYCKELGSREGVELRVIAKLHRSERENTGYFSNSFPLEWPLGKPYKRSPTRGPVTDEEHGGYTNVSLQLLLFTSQRSDF